MSCHLCFCERCVCGIPTQVMCWLLCQPSSHESHCVRKHALHTKIRRACRVCDAAWCSPALRTLVVLTGLLLPSGAIICRCCTGYKCGWLVGKGWYVVETPLGPSDLRVTHTHTRVHLFSVSYKHKFKYTRIHTQFCPCRQEGGCMLATQSLASRSIGAQTQN